MMADEEINLRSTGLSVEVNPSILQNRVFEIKGFVIVSLKSNNYVIRDMVYI